MLEMWIAPGEKFEVIIHFDFKDRKTRKLKRPIAFPYPYYFRIFLNQICEPSPTMSSPQPSSLISEEENLSFDKVIRFDIFTSLFFISIRLRPFFPSLFLP